MRRYRQRGYSILLVPDLPAPAAMLAPAAELTDLRAGWGHG
ncbi:hypothetical protein [Nocardia brasiliensis]|nr:hypothetical protein [Nocardia brasiliensis]